MGVRHFEPIWQDERLSATETLVAIALADHADHDGRAWPSIGRLTARTRLSERKIRDAIRRLEELDHVATTRASGPHGVNVYRLRSTGEGGDPRHHMPPPPAPHAPKPSGNPQGTVSEPSSSARGADDDVQTEREQVLAAIGVEPSGVFGAAGRMIGGVDDCEEMRRWRDDLGLDMPTIVSCIEEVMARRKDQEPPFSFKYFSKRMQKTAAEKARPKMTVITGAQHEQRHTDRPENAHGSRNRPDPALEQITRLAGLPKASGNGGI